jgi:hypothetical protein
MIRLIRLRGFPIPVNVSDRSNMCTRLSDVLEVEDLIAKKRSHITNKSLLTWDMEKSASESSRKSSISDL